MVLLAFPFMFALELLAVTGGEMESPRHNLPKALKRYFHRLIFFYCFSVLAIGPICPSKASALTNGGQRIDSILLYAMKRCWFLALRRRHPKRWHLHPPRHRQRRHNYERMVIR
jgi:amino acid permease